MLVNMGLTEDDKLLVRGLEHQIEDSQSIVAEAGVIIVSEALNVGRSAAEGTAMNTDYIKKEIERLNEAIDKISKARKRIDRCYKEAQERTKE